MQDIEIQGMYFCKREIYDLIREVGGQWTDSKERPIVFFLESLEFPKIYWAIPVGNYNHRDQKAKDRIDKFLNYPMSDLRSCYYHLGKTTVRSIFFISDVIPLKKEFVDREYKGYDGNVYIIKNKVLKKELERKLLRILAFERGNPNYFRQHITDLIQKLSE